MSLRCMIFDSAGQKNSSDKHYLLIDKGDEYKLTFIRDIVPRLKITLLWHPAKFRDPTYINFINSETMRDADVIYQTVPFFKAKELCEIEPQYAVTLSRKDYLYYLSRFPNAIIYWWIDWKQLFWYSYRVSYMSGIWAVEFSSLLKYVELGGSALQSYGRNTDDLENPSGFYIFDLRKFKWLTYL